jgi:hypothetical protein
MATTEITNPLADGPSLPDSLEALRDRVDNSAELSTGDYQELIDDLGLAAETEPDHAEALEETIELLRNDFRAWTTEQLRRSVAAERRLHTGVAWADVDAELDSFDWLAAAEHELANRTIARVLEIKAQVAA